MSTIANVRGAIKIVDKKYVRIDVVIKYSYPSVQIASQCSRRPFRGIIQHDFYDESLILILLPDRIFSWGLFTFKYNCTPLCKWVRVKKQ